MHNSFLPCSVFGVFYQETSRPFAVSTTARSCSSHGRDGTRTRNSITGMRSKRTPSFSRTGSGGRVQATFPEPPSPTQARSGTQCPHTFLEVAGPPATAAIIPLHTILNLKTRSPHLKALHPPRQSLLNSLILLETGARPLLWKRSLGNLTELGFKTNLLSAGNPHNSTIPDHCRPGLPTPMDRGSLTCRTNALGCRHYTSRNQEIP